MESIRLTGALDTWNYTCTVQTADAAVLPNTCATKHNPGQNFAHVPRATPLEPLPLGTAVQTQAYVSSAVYKTDQNAQAE